MGVVAMNETARTKLSKYLSFLLRHQPEAAGLKLDDEGWVAVDLLLEGCASAGEHLSRAQLDEIVATCPKQRFALSEDGKRIRANQGHSTAVELGYEPAEPPDVLYHGTVRQVLGLIYEEGLQKMQRHHVHLSADEATAKTVGKRRGKPVILVIDARAMRAAGHDFFCTPNGVWLTDAVPPEFISTPEECATSIFPMRRSP